MEKSDFIEYFKEIAKATRHLMAMVPEERFSWAPADNMMTLGRLVAHLAYSPGVVFYLLRCENLPERYTAFEQMPLEEALREFDCNTEGAVELMQELPEEDFGGKEIKAFWGAVERRSKLLMMIFDHLLNHKMQLFTYLKMLGFSVTTSDLYLGEPGEISS